MDIVASIAEPETGEENVSLAAALDYKGRRGWSVIDLPRRGKKPDLKNWQNKRYTPDQLRVRFAHYRNVGVILGEPSGLIDVDLDYPLAARYAAAELPATDAVFGRAGKPGSHRLHRSTDPSFRRAVFEDPLPREAGGIGVILEIRGNGQQTVMPGSIHESGESIRWVSDGEPSEQTAEELLPSAGRLAAMVLLASRYGAGTRHELVLPLAGGLAYAGWSQGETERFLHRVGEMAGDPDWEDRRKAIETTYRRLEEGEEVTGWPTLAERLGHPVTRRLKNWLGIAETADRLTHSDTGNARRLVVRHGENLRYCKALRGWLVWDGRRWVHDETGQIGRWADETAKSIYDEAKEEPDSDKQGKIAAFALASQDIRRHAAMVKMAEHQEGIVESIDAFDADPWLLNVENGTLNLADVRVPGTPARGPADQAGTGCL